MTGGMRSDILMLCFKVLSLHVVLIDNVQSSLAESVTVEILRLYGRNVSSISWNFGDALFALHLLELFVYFFGNMAEWLWKYPV